jgi:GrpB-like predicted nucleotidyltransferase (UPF0157 family)
MNVEWFDSPKRDPPVLRDHDPAWAALAREWIGQISHAIGASVARIEHVGSTAVPGLPAKPVIDIQVAVPALEDEMSYRPALEGLGLILRTRAPDHRFFRPPADRPRVVHVHACQRDSEWERQHLLFRDFLIDNPDWAVRYAELKRHLAMASPDRAAYGDGKRPFIEQALAHAQDQARRAHSALDRSPSRRGPPWGRGRARIR